MGEPKGHIVTPLADNPDDELRSLEVDVSDNLKVVEQGTPTVIAKPHADEKLFGIESVIIKRKAADTTTSWITMYSDAVPTGKIWKLTRIVAWNQDGDIATEFAYYVFHNAAYAKLYYKKGSIAQYETIDKDVELYLEAGDHIRADFIGIASPETCRLNIFGYEMNAP